MYEEHYASGESLPCWLVGHPSEDGARDLPVQGADVVVVGAGMSGLSVAYHLLEAGRSVLVLDRGAVGRGETARSTAHMATALDDHYYLLERMHGQAGAKLAFESHRAAIDDIFRIVEREQIRCELERVPGYLFVESAESRRELERELEASRRAGLSVELLDRAPLPFQTRGALRFLDQAQIDPMAYLSGLLAAVHARGGIVCTGLEVERIEEGTPAIVHVRTSGGASARVAAGAVVVATNSPINDMFAIHTKQAPYRTYVVGLEVPSSVMQRALFWDTLDPYHYLRLTGDGLLLVGGEDHKVGQSQDPAASWARLEQWTRERFRDAAELRFRWSGQVLEPADGLAFIGKNPGRADNIFITTGDSGNGITHGALAGLLLTDLVLGRENPWAKLYNPSRKIIRPQAVREFLRENANVARQYASDYLSGGDATPIACGEGAVVRRGAHKIAIYVDDAGQKHECSATCPHLGGVVHWNGAERSWDCPCHGSRFDPFGRVLTGPARSDLQPIESEPERAVAVPPPASAE